MDPLRFDDVQAKLMQLRDYQVLIDADVAELYGVETKRINEAVKNNPDRFPHGYIYELSKREQKELVENFDRFKKLKHSSAQPKAFTEKGLYMLATILRSRKAVETTLAIIETFAKVRTLNSTLKDLSVITDKSRQKMLMEKGGKIIAEILDEGFSTEGCETTIELNFAVLKFKHTILKKRDGG